MGRTGARLQADLEARAAVRRQAGRGAGGTPKQPRRARGRRGPSQKNQALHALGQLQTVISSSKAEKHPGARLQAYLQARAAVGQHVGLVGCEAVVGARLDGEAHAPGGGGGRGDDCVSGKALRGLGRGFWGCGCALKGGRGEEAGMLCSWQNAPPNPGPALASLSLFSLGTGRPQVPPRHPLCAALLAVAHRL